MGPCVALRLPNTTGQQAIGAHRSRFTEGESPPLAADRENRWAGRIRLLAIPPITRSSFQVSNRDDDDLVSEGRYTTS
jgi:hypothetical protein